MGLGPALPTVPSAQPTARRWPLSLEEGFRRLRDLPTPWRGGELEARAPTDPALRLPRLCKVLGLGKKFLARHWLSVSSFFFR